MFEIVSNPRDLPTPEEIESQASPYEQRDTIEIFGIVDADYGTDATLFPVNSPGRAAIADKFARYFHKELHRFDFQPYAAGDETDDRLVFLVRTGRIRSMVPLAAGCVALERVQDEWTLTWVWIHPWERGGDAVGTTFDDLDKRFGPFRILAPTSKAFAGLMRKRGYDDNRLGTINR